MLMACTYVYANLERPGAYPARSSSDSGVYAVNTSMLMSTDALAPPSRSGKLNLPRTLTCSAALVLRRPASRDQRECLRSRNVHVLTICTRPQRW